MSNWIRGNHKQKGEIKSFEKYYKKISGAISNMQEHISTNKYHINTKKSYEIYGFC